MKKISVVYKGKTYKSIKSLCDEKMVSYAMVMQRLKRNFSIEDAIDIPISYHRNGKSIIYKGKKYPSIRNLAIEKGIPYHVVQMRLKNGKSIEVAVETPVGDLERKSIEFNNVVYPSFSKLCKEFNMNPTLVLSRLNMGWSLSKSLKTPVRKMQNNYIPELVYNGKKYPSLRVLCNELNIDYINTLNRLHRGKTLKEAIETPKRIRKDKK